jgi:hypothetical protein
MATATLEKSWVVDYDLPKFPVARRVAFYRIKRRLIKDATAQNSEVRILLSSMSVLLTNSEGLARNVSALAQDFAATETHVYAVDSMQEIQEWPT